MSRTLLVAIVAGAVILDAPLEVGAVVFTTVALLARYLAVANTTPNVNTRGRNLTVASDDTLYVQPDAFGDYPSVQAAVDAAPKDGTERILYLAAGTYDEAVIVPSGTRNLFIKGITGDASDVILTGDRAHGMTNPATGQPYGTEGSAVLTVKAPGATVANLTVQNTFDPANHPEVDAYSTQAVALAAEGDRQTFSQCRLIARQDTVLCKAPVATGQYRQYFVGCYVEGAIDFIFGNATAVFDECNIALKNWAGAPCSHRTPTRATSTAS
ncbi:pectinesterase family protein [Streptomyces sp. L7]